MYVKYAVLIEENQIPSHILLPLDPKYSADRSISAKYVILNVFHLM